MSIEALLEGIQAEIAAKDRRIAELEAQLGRLRPLLAEALAALEPGDRSEPIDAAPRQKQPKPAKKQAKGRGRVFTQPERDELAADYQAGMPLAEMRAKWGVSSDASLYRQLKLAGVPNRGKLPQQPASRPEAEPTPVAVDGAYAEYSPMGASAPILICRKCGAEVERAQPGEFQSKFCAACRESLSQPRPQWTAAMPEEAEP